MGDAKGKGPSAASAVPLGWQEYYAKRTAGMRVEVRHIDAIKGRGLFALADVKEGEEIFAEEPLVCAQFLWNELYGYVACHHCLRSLESPARMAERLSGIQGARLPLADRLRDDEAPATIRCDVCEAPFCSSSCMSRANAQYHRLLCVRGHWSPARLAAAAQASAARAAAEPKKKGKGKNKVQRLDATTDSAGDPLAALEDAWRACHYPPENASVMLLARIVATIRQGLDDGLSLPDAMLPFSFFHKAYIDNTQQLSHKLVDPKFDKDVVTLTALFKQALFDERLAPYFTLDGFRSLLALVGMNGQGIGTSALNDHCRRLQSLALDAKDREELDGAIDVLYDAIEEVSGDFDECEGSGLYAVQSTCNHSCSPNAVPQFTHGCAVLSMVALRDIAAGEEVCISYLDDCERRQRVAARRAHLLKNYMFHCTCARCEAGDAADTELSDDEHSHSGNDSEYEDDNGSDGAGAS